MAKCRQRIKIKKKKKKQDLLSTYSDPRAPGALGGLRRFARAQRLSQAQARDALRKNLAFTLHCLPRRRFKMAPVMVLNIDQQWVADLVAIGSSCQVWSLALGYHPNRYVGLGSIVHGCLGRAYRDLHHTIGQLGCGAGQEGDGLGEAPHGISIITTLPRPRHGACLLFVTFLMTRGHTSFFPFRSYGCG